MPLKRWLREGLDDFRPSTQKDQSYEANIKGHPQMGLTAKDVGFTDVTLVVSEMTKKIDLVLEKVLEVMERELGTSRWMGAKIIRRFLR